MLNDAKSISHSLLSTYTSVIPPHAVVMSPFQFPSPAESTEPPSILGRLGSRSALATLLLPSALRFSFSRCCCSARRASLSRSLRCALDSNSCQSPSMLASLDRFIS